MNPQPTFRQQRLSGLLRDLRKTTDLTQQDVADQLAVNVTTVHRWESGATRPSRRKLQRLLELYRVDDKTRESTLKLAKDAADGHGWWQPYATDLYPALVSLIGLEAEAVAIWNYESLFIPGLLQTPAYARAVFEGSLPMGEQEIDTNVKVRIERQEVLSRDTPPRLWAVIDEAALHRQVGGPGVMAEQMRHLLRVTQAPNVTVQIIPYDVGAHPGMGGPFAILDLSEEDASSFVYLEGMAGRLFLEDTTDLRRFREVVEHLQAAALSPADSLAMVATLTGVGDK